MVSLGGEIPKAAQPELRLRHLLERRRGECCPNRPPRDAGKYTGGLAPLLDLSPVPYSVVPLARPIVPPSGPLRKPLFYGYRGRGAVFEKDQASGIPQDCRPVHVRTSTNGRLSHSASARRRLPCYLAARSMRTRRQYWSSSRRTASCR